MKSLAKRYLIEKTLEKKGLLTLNKKKFRKHLIFVLPF